MGTIGVEATAGLDGMLRGVRPDMMFVDAPVSGSKGPAETGQLLVLASGPAAAEAITAQADAKLHKIARGDFTPEFPLEWALKDVDLAIAAASGSRLPMLRALSGQWRQAVEAGYGRDDVSAARLALSDPA